jgi:hypothetical protein
MTIFSQKVAISRRLWIAVAVIVAGFLSNVVVMQKGGETMRVYDFWLSVFRPSLYSGERFADILMGLGMIALITLIVFGISTLVGWFISAVFGSWMLVFGKRK